MQALARRPKGGDGVVAVIYSMLIFEEEVGNGDRNMIAVDIEGSWEFPSVP